MNLSKVVAVGIACLGQFFFLQPLYPLASPPARSKHVEARLFSEVDAFKPGEAFTVALRLTMDPGWHTYWMNPGDSGAATTVEWELPPGFQAGPLQWPVPELLLTPPLASYGYEKEVWILAQIQPPAHWTGGPARLGARMRWVECALQCIPGHAEVSLELPASPTQAVLDPGLAVGFAEARARLPSPPPEGWQSRFRMEGGKLILEVHAQERWDLKDSDRIRFFPLSGGIIRNAGSQLWSVHGSTLLIQMEPDSQLLAGALPQNLSGVLAIEREGKRSGWRIEAPRWAPSPSGGKPGAPSRALWVSVLGAFVGGLLLNLMPCVLPVLSLKVLHIVESSRDQPRRALLHGLSFAGGVLLSFWVLAFLLLVLRGLGKQLGWGFQLQSPGFVASMTFLFLAISLNLFGVFEIGAGLGRLEERVESLQGLAQSFVGGVLAALVASPCTAPFMGAAVGIALHQGILVNLLIFTGLGLGMAFPLTFLSAFPRLLHWLPKPGPWMETFKQLLGFPMLGATLWLLWLYGQLRGNEGLFRLLVSLWILSFALWVYGRFGHPGRSYLIRLSARLLLLAAVITSYGYATTGFLTEVSKPAENSPAQGGAGLTAIPFSRARLQELRSKGVPVFVDFRAAWCLTCQVNERIALENPEVQRRFRELGIVWMVADWTNPNEEISQMLAQFGRSGVPFYLLYGPDPSLPPEVLPELLTPGIVLQALDKLAAQWSRSRGSTVAAQGKISPPQDPNALATPEAKAVPGNAP
ncbi:protein-disulfide reductase DsbD family protein [Candidatus Methylacidithermus pantelleriae]|uniref:Cytochrome c-type biogenesis protein DsbD, protein-disulfide reductase n=1 Tax=Candidatus Methylacidithermus pantelleriae TaxID=2744239 RepID=A0A8J2BLH7_9BACT|nr:thioredoxin family protein [Candidatus Methylacidithermus pantelleriae]CAF0699141.1 Cytochrome c-type biogenesis protein DsbD, protein-disulfide reductase [Candidatus Methylacidithermus pantelleriae]